MIAVLHLAAFASLLLMPDFGVLAALGRAGLVLLAALVLSAR